MGIFGDEMWEVKEQKKANSFLPHFQLNLVSHSFHQQLFALGSWACSMGARLSSPLNFGQVVAQTPKHELTINRSFDTPIRFTFLILTPKALQFHAVFFFEC